MILLVEVLEAGIQGHHRFMLLNIPGAESMMLRPPLTSLLRLITGCSILFNLIREKGCIPLGPRPELVPPRLDLAIHPSLTITGTGQVEKLTIQGTRTALFMMAIIILAMVHTLSLRDGG